MKSGKNILTFSSSSKKEIIKAVRGVMGSSPSVSDCVIGLMS